MDEIQKKVEKLSVLILKQGNKDTYLIPVSGLLKLANHGIIKRWEQNREEDNGRVEKIRRHQIARSCVEGIIYFGYIEGQGLVCYDGQHRRIALSPEISHIKVLISIIWKATEEILEKEFDLINRSVKVPRVYIDKSLANVKSIFIAFSQYLEGRYPKFVSGSGVCKRPNFNRDSLVDDLLSIHESKKFGSLVLERLIELIKYSNKCYRKEKFGFEATILTKNIRLKCETFGLWLFCESRSIDRSYLKKCFKEFVKI